MKSLHANTFPRMRLGGSNDNQLVTKLDLRHLSPPEPMQQALAAAEGEGDAMTASLQMPGRWALLRLQA
jgi:hypothetical protein